MSSPSLSLACLLSGYMVFLCFCRFMPTVATCTGSYRSMMAYIPKHQFMQLKNANQVSLTVLRTLSSLPIYNMIWYERDFVWQSWCWVNAISGLNEIGYCDSNFTQVQHIYGLPKDWEGKVDQVHELFSRVPNYSKVSA